MKKITFLALCLCASVYGWSQSTVKVKISGIITERGGQVSVGIFDNKKKFPKYNKYLLNKTIPVSGTTAEVVFENIKAGEYAIAVYQDEDSNRQLDSNFFGYPKEPVGFSNGAKIKLGPPDFKDAAFFLNTEEVKTIEVTLVDY